MSLSRAARFDRLVLEAVERLEEFLPAVGAMDVMVTEVPPDPGPDGSISPDPRGIPLGHAEPAKRNQPARIVLHRRPIEMRTTSAADTAALVADVVAEQVAELLGMRPEDVDPGYSG